MFAKGAAKRGLLAAVPVLAALLAPFGAGGGVAGNTAAQDIAWFNAQRAANGIPAGIVENPEWSASCDAHITYMQRTNTFQHEEDPSSSFYTARGEWGGTHSVLAGGSSWGADRDPWETAPIHLAQLMSPQLAEMGVADRDTFVCATTWPGMDRPTPTAAGVVTYPGDGTTTYADEVPAESPFTPEDILGMPSGVRTGPNLYVYLWGPVLDDYWTAAKISVAAATLTGPDGPLPLRWVDATTPKIGPYLPPASGILVPPPLLHGATYTAGVQFSDGTQHTWTFHTALKTNTLQIRGAAARTGGLGRIDVYSTAPNVTLRLTRQGVVLRVHAQRIAGGLRVMSRLVRPGTVACATSGGGSTGYVAERVCRRIG
jgi:hypothetical protein